ncbi:hypothetical protein M0R45_034363 [Rubus argutus]|uniref:Uncharacterized protein n=1 Tax=Rubus argutus TaxID=59490 RepID=A0AAW1VSW9_RUBAR
MYLKKPQWTEGITPKASPESESDSPTTAVGDLVNSLTTQRVYREVTLALLVPPSPRPSLAPQVPPIRSRVRLHHQPILPGPIYPRTSSGAVLSWRISTRLFRC